MSEGRRAQIATVIAVIVLILLNAVLESVLVPWVVAGLSGVAVWLLTTPRRPRDDERARTAVERKSE